MTIDAEPLSGSLGAEIRGIDLANLDDTDFKEVQTAFPDHFVLVFRDQKLTPEQQIAFGRRWGPGDLVLWDNRSVQHVAVHDHGEAERRLHRFTVVGDVPR